MSSLVEGHYLPVLLLYHSTASFGTHDDLVSTGRRVFNYVFYTATSLLNLLYLEAMRPCTRMIFIVIVHTA